MFRVACAIVAAALAVRHLGGVTFIEDVAFIALLALWPREREEVLPTRRPRRVPTEVERLVMRSASQMPI